MSKRKVLVSKQMYQNKAAQNRNLKPAYIQQKSVYKETSNNVTG